ncbi:MAG: penicillin acylase family protein [Acetobacterales bacterium]
MPPGRSGRTAATIYRDAWGIPSVVADNDSDTIHGFGYAQGEDHLPELLFLVLQIRGDLAAAFGPDCLESDRRLRTLGIHRDARAGLGSVAPEVRETVLWPFADGLNAYAADARTTLPRWMADALPVTEADILALHGFYGFVLAMSNDAWRYGQHVAMAPWGRSGGARPLASNGFALAGSRTASGHPILGANPHVYLYSPMLMTEARLKGDRLDIRGWTFLGLPLFLFGHTSDSAWAVTIGYPDSFDRAFVVGDGNRYMLDGRWRPFEFRPERIDVRGAGPVDQGVLETPHGPVIARLPDGNRVALDWTTRSETGMPEQLWRMNTATSRAEFEGALSMMQFPNYAFMHADAGGGLLYAYLGRVYRRDPGSVDGSAIGCGTMRIDWWEDSAAPEERCAALARYNGVLPGIPGWTSATTGREIYPDGAFPRVADPASGWLQMANTPPWTATAGLPRECDDAGVIVPCGDRPALKQNLRGEGFSGILAETSAATLEAASAIYLDARVTGARYAMRERLCLDGTEATRGTCGLLPALDQAWEKIAPRLPADRHKRLSAAVDLLRDWDGTASADSRAMLLYLGYAHAIGSDLRGHSEADADERIAALEAAAGFVIERFGQLDPPWRSVNILRRHLSPLRREGPPAEAPVPGAPQFVGTLHAYESAGFLPLQRRFDGGLAANPGEDGRADPDFGTVALMMVELDPAGVRARAASVYGQSEDPASPHFADQLERLISRGKLRDAPFSVEATRAAATSVTVLHR